MSGKTKTEVQTSVTPAEAVTPQVEQIDQSVSTPTAAVNAGQQPTVEKMFTQAEINTIIAQRIQQERGKYADYEQLQQQVQTLTAAQQAEQERSRVLEQQNQSLSKVTQEKSVEAAIARAAAAIELDPDAALKLFDVDKLQTDSAGNVINAADVVKAVAEKYPGLLKRRMPVANAVNPPAGGANVMPEVREARQRQEYFGGNSGSFWNAGSVRLPIDLLG